MTAVIQSIQTVSITIAASSTSNTATITSVNTANAIILYQGLTSSESSATAYEDVASRVELTNATTVTATRGASANAVTVKAVVIEFSSGVNSVQAGTIVISAATSNTATISAVGANAFVIWLGASCATATRSAGGVATSVVLTNSTTVTANVGTSQTITVGYMVADLGGTIINSAPQPKAHADTTANASFTDTITGVTTTQALIIYNGATNANAGGGANNFQYRLDLTNGTTVTATRSGASATSKTVYYTVVEFVAGILQSSVQRGDIALSAATSNTATVSSVNTSYAFANWANFNVATSTPNVGQSTVALTNATTVTAAVDTAGSPTISYEVIEFAPPANDTLMAQAWL